MNVQAVFSDRPGSNIGSAMQQGERALIGDILSDPP